MSGREARAEVYPRSTEQPGSLARGTGRGPRRRGSRRLRCRCSGLGLTGLQERRAIGRRRPCRLELQDNGKFVLKAWMPWQK